MLGDVGILFPIIGHRTFKYHRRFDSEMNISLKCQCQCEFPCPKYLIWTEEVMKLIGSGSTQIMCLRYIGQTIAKKVDSNIQHKQSQGKNSPPIKGRSTPSRELCHSVPMQRCIISDTSQWKADFLAADSGNSS